MRVKKKICHSNLLTVVPGLVSYHGHIKKTHLKRRIQVVRMPHCTALNQINVRLERLDHVPFMSGCSLPFTSPILLARQIHKYVLCTKY